MSKLTCSECGMEFDAIGVGGREAYHRHMTEHVLEQQREIIELMTQVLGELVSINSLKPDDERRERADKLLALTNLRKQKKNLTSFQRLPRHPVPPKKKYKPVVDDDDYYTGDAIE